MSLRLPIVERRSCAVVGDSLQALEQHGEGRVLALLVLVAHDRHLAVEVLLRDEGVDHAVGLHLDRPREVVARRLKSSK
jgi:hypothetical protein